MKDNQIASCLNCGEFYGKIGDKIGGLRLVAPQSIERKHPTAGGVVIGLGYMQCKCGWTSPSFRTEQEIIEAWNEIMY